MSRAVLPLLAATLAFTGCTRREAASEQSKPAADTAAAAPTAPKPGIGGPASASSVPTGSPYGASNAEPSTATIITTLLDDSGFMSGFARSANAQTETAGANYRATLEALRLLPGRFPESKSYFIPASKIAEPWDKFNIGEQAWPAVYVEDFYGRSVRLAEVLAGMNSVSADQKSRLFVVVTHLMQDDEQTLHLLVNRVNDFFKTTQGRVSPYAFGVLRITTEFTGVLPDRYGQKFPRYSGPLSAYVLLFGKKNDVSFAAATLARELKIAPDYFEFSPFLSDQQMMFTKLLDVDGRFHGSPPTKVPNPDHLDGGGVLRSDKTVEVNLRPLIPATPQLERISSSGVKLAARGTIRRYEGSQWVDARDVRVTDAIDARLVGNASRGFEVRLLMKTTNFSPGIYSLELDITVDPGTPPPLPLWITDEWSMTPERARVFAKLTDDAQDRNKVLKENYPSGIGTYHLKEFFEQLNTVLTAQRPAELGRVKFLLEVGQ